MDYTSIFTLMRAEVTLTVCRELEDYVVLIILLVKCMY